MLKMLVTEHDANLPVIPVNVVGVGLSPKLTETRIGMLLRGEKSGETACFLISREEAEGLHKLLAKAIFEIEMRHPART